ncbi:MAG: FAD-binding oxidoreductase, partial [Actinobacteria bacterium]|nr:FAD-binding oxidoreductase [Actinomycetota bacterium]
GVAAMAGVDLPVHPLRRQLQCTKPVPRPRDPLPMVIDMTDGTHFRRESGGLLIGRVNPAEPFGFNFAVDWDWLAGTVELAVKRVPVLADAEILRAWAGLYEVTPDNHPVLGAVPEVPGFYLANGFSGHGFMHSPSAGRAVAEIILRGRSETVDVSMLDLGRFARGEEIHGLELI